MKLKNLFKKKVLIPTIIFLTGSIVTANADMRISRSTIDETLKNTVNYSQVQNELKEMQFISRNSVLQNLQNEENRKFIDWWQNNTSDSYMHENEAKAILGILPVKEQIDLSKVYVDKETKSKLVAKELRQIVEDFYEFVYDDKNAKNEQSYDSKKTASSLRVINDYRDYGFDEEYLENEIRFGDCQDIALFAVQTANVNYNLKGIVISEFGHALAMIELPNSTFVVLGSNFKNEIYNNPYQFLSSSRHYLDFFELNNNIFDKDGNLLGLVKDKKQKEMTDKVYSVNGSEFMPNILENLKISKTEEHTSPTVFILGDNTEKLSGQSLNILNKMRQGTIDLNFRITATTFNYEHDDESIPHLGLSFLNNTNINIFDNNKLNLQLGNLFKGYFLSSFEDNILKSKPDLITSSSEMETSPYIMLKSDKLYALGSLGFKHFWAGGNLINEQDKELVTVEKKEVGIGFVGEGVRFDAFLKKELAKTTTSFKGEVKIDRDIFATATYRDVRIEGNDFFDVESFEVGLKKRFGNNSNINISASQDNYEHGKKEYDVKIQLGYNF